MSSIKIVDLMDVNSLLFIFLFNHSITTCDVINTGIRCRELFAVKVPDESPANADDHSIEVKSN